MRQSSSREFGYCWRTVGTQFWIESLMRVEEVKTPSITSRLSTTSSQRVLYQRKGAEPMLLSMGEVGRETCWRTCMHAMYLDVIRAEFHGGSSHGIGHLLKSKSGCRRSVNGAVLNTGLRI